ncbi:MAG: hypothetical protein J2P15_05820, partial [Micromonosporaceae bacterium]|nr:hypothetical protein [Micromonosporaceae bacterium]
MVRRRRWRFPKPLTTVAILAAVFFALGSVGSPLLGMSVFAGTDELSTRSPYLDAGFAGIPVQNQGVDDTYTAQLPNTLLYTQSVRQGDSPQWNPYISGGVPLGATVNYALYDPLTLPYYLLPGWLAPGYEKLLEILCAIVGGFLFLRRIRLGRPAALLGGTIYAGTAFMVVWTNWPQTRVAAFIPWVFWAAERLVARWSGGQRRRVADVALLALPIAFMLLGGFPAVTAFALLTAAGYLVVRALAEYRDRPRRLVGVIGAAAVSVVGGLALAAVQLVPFVGFYRHWLIEGRAQTPGDHLHIADLATLFAPWTFGGWQSSNAGKPIWYLPLNMIESLSYLGAAALVLVLVAVAVPGAGRRLLPRSAWLYLVLVTGGWLVLIYVGGPLRVLQHLPVFSSNFIGRARSILGFLLAVLAAVGFEVLLRRRA